MSSGTSWMTSRMMNVIDLDAGNKATVNVEFLGAPGGSWLRDQAAIQLLSDPVQ